MEELGASVGHSPATAKTAKDLTRLNLLVGLQRRFQALIARKTMMSMLSNRIKKLETTTMCSHPSKSTRKPLCKFFSWKWVSCSTASSSECRLPFPLVTTSPCCSLPLSSIKLSKASPSVYVSRTSTGSTALHSPGSWLSHTVALHQAAWQSA